MTTIDINPTDWHDTRFINHIPEHFVTVKAKEDETSKILEWITKSCGGRYGMHVNVSKKSSGITLFVKEDVVIGFEDPADATMFTLFYK